MITEPQFRIVKLKIAFLQRRIADLQKQAVAMKRIKVDLPKPAECNPSASHERLAFTDGYNRALEDCADALRKAGLVEKGHDIPPNCAPFFGPPDGM